MSTDSKKMFLFAAVRDPGLLSVFSTHFTRVYSCQVNERVLKFAYKISENSPIRVGKGFPPIYFVASFLDSMIVTSEGTLSVGKGISLSDSNSEVLELDLKSGAMPVHSYHPMFPKGVLARTVSFLADGRRIAWETFEVGAGNVTAIYVSAIDCSNMRELGHINGDGTTNAINNLRWLPDGKTLAFDLAKSTWTVPAD